MIPLLAALATVALLSSATNYSADILGTPDTRPDTWGRAGVQSWKIRFKPPAGHRVRIVRVYGDFLIWPKGLVEPGRFAGALFGLQTTAPEGSVHADLAADNTMLYVQTATGGGPARTAFDYDVSAGGLLEPDHVLVVKVAVWLNDTEREIHCEPSFTMVYRYEPIN
jgi:hypothetical protein